MTHRIRILNEEHSYNFVCSGYLVKDSKVLLVHHNRFNLWVPPGGHVEAGELFHETAEREFFEETGMKVRAITDSALEYCDSNATNVPTPFYCDVETEGFSVPVITQFFWMMKTEDSPSLKPQLSEVYDVKFFSYDELDDLPTFDQVRVVARFALANFPRLMDI